MKPTAFLICLLTLLFCQCEEEVFTLRLFNRIELVSPAEGAVMDNGCLNQTDPVTWEFSWNTFPGAEQYELVVINNSTATPVIDVVVYESAYFYICNGCYNTSLDFTWKVRALVNASWQIWSEERSFTVENVDTDC